MYPYKINDIRIELSHIIFSTEPEVPAKCSNDEFLLPLDDEQFANDLAARHGLTNYKDLLHFTFISYIDNFNDAFRILLFGKHFDGDVFEDILIPAIQLGTEPEYRCFSNTFFLDYLNQEKDLDFDKPEIYLGKIRNRIQDKIGLILNPEVKYKTKDTIYFVVCTKRDISEYILTRSSKPLIRIKSSTDQKISEYKFIE